MKWVKSLLSDTFHLFYPHLCCSCGSDLLERNQHLCLQCLLTLPRTAYADIANNPVEKIMTGRFPFMEAYCELYFQKDSITQTLIHQLKYKGNRDLGYFLGELMGKTIKNSSRFRHLEGIVPLPLHPVKLKKRGYNQAEILANGIASILEIPVYKENLIRKKYAESQTTRSNRNERWQNVLESFTINQPEELTNKNILLIDDVITTGATLDAAATVLSQIEGIQINIAGLAIALD